MKASPMKQTLACAALLILLIVAACAPAAQQSPTPEPSTTTLPATQTPEPLPTAALPTATAEPQPSPTTGQAASDGSIDGRWEGSLSVAGMSLTNIVHFRTTDGVLQATLDIPEQNLFGYQLSEVSFDGVKVHFEGFAEANRKAVWEGALNEDGRITGTFEQAGYQGTFELTPAEMLAQAEPPPYPVEEVTFNNGEITLGGTLTIPEGEGPFPAVVLISGSGAQNRDEEILGFKIFGIIADHFTRSGIAVLRYDDRGVGASTGSLTDSTSEDLAGDALAAVNFLLERPEINPNSIGLMGHSEGGIIAPMVANQSDDVAMIILLAGTALPGEEIIYQQVERIARAEGVSEEEIEAGLEQQRRLFDALLRGGDWEAMKAELRQEIADQVNALPAEQKESLGDVEEYIDLVTEQQVGALESPWYRYFLTYDPAPALEQVSVPVLGIFGELDMQVPADTNAPAMEAALQRGGNPDMTIRIYPQANHLFQAAITGGTSEYGTLEKAFVPGLLEDMTAWILERVEPAP